RISSSVTGGSKLKRILMFLHIRFDLEISRTLKPRNKTLVGGKRQSRLPVLALKEREFLDQPVEANEHSKQEHRERQPGLGAKVKVEVMPQDCARDHRPPELEADRCKTHHSAGA